MKFFLEKKKKKEDEGDASSLETDIPKTDRDLKPLLTVLGSCLVYFSAFGIINSFGFFQEYYQSTGLTDTPASTISFIGTLQITLMNVLAAPAGSLFDCYGLKNLYILSGLGCAGGLLALSFSETDELYQLFLIQGVLLGVAIALGAQPALVVAGQHFQRRRALVMGIVAASGSVGGVCFPIIFARLMPQVGFAWTLRVVATVVAVSYAIALSISWTKLPPKPLRGAGQLFDFKGFLDKRYSVLAVGAFVAMLGQYVPYYYITSYCSTSNPNSSAKDYLLPLMNAASILGRILGGLAADETGPTNITYPMTILSGIQCLGMWLVTSDVGVLVVFVILYGFCSGVFIAVLPVIAAQLSPADKLGGRIGALYTVLAAAQLVGSPIGGSLIQSSTDFAFGYMGLIVFGGVTLFVGGIVVFISRILQHKDLSLRL
ncbi:MFS general substrate transporter [Aaosphaeria arxii CBS 175.79]|uniref:MFS general substrate transporter n=1 Tax=Aaosphaeria arxii CBS 175.79 TaxID=1450172 RepID=A0A6A5X944_9PLEO|nr:MFS general substrate transporter [Aaosphaeria arxii CBS 175.79]KAF2009488.1 MFS general substrate transporter [Aaosphaeria arxii CBS 175.79]